MRGKNETSRDEYSLQTDRQNSGLPCEHCNSMSGHKKFCSLIIGNRTRFEPEAITVAPQVDSSLFNDQDRTLLAKMHISL